MKNLITHSNRCVGTSHDAYNLDDMAFKFFQFTMTFVHLNTFDTSKMGRYKGCVSDLKKHYVR